MDETNKKIIMHVQSAQNRIIIKNGLLVNHDQSQYADVYIEDSIIKQVGNHLIIPGGTRVIDALGKLVIPGGIDPNVHFQTPVETQDFTQGTRTIDDFYVGTKAALKGGTTTIIDTVLPQKEESLVKAFEKWQAWAEEKSCCDFAFKMKLPSVLNEERKGELRDLAMENSINCFVASMEDYSDADLVELFEACTSSGCIAQVHAESAEFVKRNAKKLLNQGLTGPEGYALAHAEEAEEEATLRASALANQLNCPLYLSHVSTSATTEIVCNKRNKGHVVCGEVHPTALALDGRGYWDQDWKKAATLVTSPPIRKEQNEALIAKLSDSESGIDIVGSNHAAFNLKQKALGLKDFTKIPVGTNGVQERMSIVWDKCVAENGPMSPERFVAVTSANAAKTFGLYPDKGYIEVGSQADIVIWNPEVVTQIDVEDQISKSDMNAFQGMTFKGQAETVILRGRVIMFENELKAVQGHGRYLPLSPYPVHIYDKIKSRQVFNFHPVERKEEEINGDIPPPEKAISFQPEKAASLHISNIDLKLHPNDEEELDRTSPVVLTRTNKHRSSIRIKNPPGGRSSVASFW